jgi:hypothetical protein
MLGTTLLAVEYDDKDTCVINIVKSNLIIQLGVEIFK